MVLTGFAGLDELSGGVQNKKNYILYGNIGTGKTSFCLQFLHQGLLKGERVALVTRRSTPIVLEHTRASGLDLERFARGGQLILFEYVANVVENSLRLKSPDPIAAEFAAFLGTDRIQRLVFDPITPLLATPASSTAIFRARSLIQSFSELQATCLYVFDTPEGEDYLPNCKDFVYGVLRFEAAAFQSSSGRLIFERFPELRQGPRQLEFEIVPGQGLVGVPGSPAMAASEPSSPRKILLIGPDDEQRKVFRQLLGKNYQVLEASGGAEGLARIAAESPNLIVLEREGKGLDGVEFCKKLRKNKANVPIILVADQIRRTRDRVETLAAGADECLERPVDGRLLKLKVGQLLQRYSTSQGPLGCGMLNTSVTAALERDKTTTTTNLAYFYIRIRQEAAYSAENGLSFALVVLRTPDGSASSQELFQLTSSLVREYDLVYAGNRGIAVLLSETDDKGVTTFLDRFKQRWKGPSEPAVGHRCFDRQGDFLEQARRLVNAIERTESPTGGVAPARA